MAMNKLERAELDRVKKKLAESRAMCFREFKLWKLVPSDLLQTGWTFNLYNRDVRQGCFRATSHSLSDVNKTDSQGCGGPWYATKSDAQKALRLEVQQDFAEILAVLDKRIELSEFNEKMDAA